MTQPMSQQEEDEVPARLRLFEVSSRLGPGDAISANVLPFKASVFDYGMLNVKKPLPARLRRGEESAIRHINLRVEEENGGVRKHLMDIFTGGSGGWDREEVVVLKFPA